MTNATVLALAVVCVGEITPTWSVTERECAAIAAVIQARAEARGMSFEGMARAYSDGHFRLDGRRDWLAGLRLDGSRPEHWPRGLSWSAHRPRWERAVQVARGVLGGPWARLEALAGCEGPVDYWGGRMDDWRALRAGWEPVDCGPTTNRFWRVPRRARTLPASVAKGSRQPLPGGGQARRWRHLAVGR